ncbi:hypothetical protein AB0M57_25505 [Streptomyces sp. NPDC051597]|uniref:hypothetical protein n=1 Tax=Streptomyces sp. NPDC051597 TaxID=3155049 RepID=UPI0034415C2F
MGIYRQTVMDLDAPVGDAAEHGQWGRDWLEAEGHIRPVPWKAMSCTRSIRISPLDHYTMCSKLLGTS